MGPRDAVQQEGVGEEAESAPPHHSATAFGKRQQLPVRAGLSEVWGIYLWARSTWEAYTAHPLINPCGVRYLNPHGCLRQVPGEAHAPCERAALADKWRTDYTWGDGQAWGGWG